MGEPLRDLPIQLEWRPGADAYAYVSALADANNVTVTRLLGSTYPAERWHRLTPSLTRRISALSGIPPEEIRQTGPYRRYPSFVVNHPVVGLLNPESPSGRTLIDTLPPHDPRTLTIQNAISRPRLGGRLLLLEELATAVVRRITDEWPPGAFEDDDRRRTWVVSDPTRHDEPRNWSRRVKEFVTLTLWEHTFLGGQRRPLQGSIATDLLLVDQLLTAADELHPTEADLAAAVRAFAEDLRSCPEPPPDWYSGPWTSEPPGPFSVPRLRAWPPVIVELIAAIDEVSTTLYLDEHEPTWMTDPLGIFWYEQTRHTPRRLERLIMHTAERPAAQLLFQQVANLAAAQPPPLSGSQLWHHRSLLPTVAQRGPRAADRAAHRALLDVVWLDLCGHLPPRAARQLDKLQAAVRGLDPAYILAARATMLDLLEGGVRETDLALPGRQQEAEATA